MSPIIAYESRGHLLAKHISMACMHVEGLLKAGHPAATLVLRLEGVAVCATNGNTVTVPWSKIASTDGRALYDTIRNWSVVSTPEQPLPEQIPTEHVIDSFGRARKARSYDDMNILALLSVLRLTYESLVDAGQAALVRQILGPDAPDEIPTQHAKRLS